MYHACMNREWENIKAIMDHPETTDADLPFPDNICCNRFFSLGIELWGTSFSEREGRLYELRSKNDNRLGSHGK